MLSRLNAEEVLSASYPAPTMRQARFDIGHAVGNKWLVDFSLNRGWRDNSFSKKISEVKAYAAKGGRGSRELLRGAFDCKDDNWSEASGDGNERWSKRRLAAFQTAIENRSAWLYRRFYEDLGFSDWVNDRASYP